MCPPSIILPFFQVWRHNHRQELGAERRALLRRDREGVEWSAGNYIDRIIGHVASTSDLKLEIQEKYVSS